MNIRRLLKAIENAPLEEATFGTINEDAENALDAINTEFIKRGTLSAEDIDWKAVEAATLGLFAHCSHLYGYVAALLLISRGTSEANLRHSMKLMGFFIDHCWPGLHPNGPRSERHKNKFLGELVSAFAAQIDDVVKAERNLTPGALSNLKSLVKRLEKLKLPVPLKALQEAIQTAKAPQPVAHRTSSNEDGFKKRELDAKERAELRRSIKSIADQILQFDPDAGVSFSMRGYAAWLEHWQEIPAQGGKIEQFPMPANIQDEHANAALKPTLTAVMRLEDRLFTSPDWMEGHKTLYSMLINLEFPNAAHAVRQRVSHRIATRRELKALKYANGAEIVTPDIENWASMVIGQADDTASENEPQNTATLAEKMFETLGALDKDLAHSGSQREVFSKRLEFGEELLAAGFNAQTLSLLNSLELEVQNVALVDWDPDFFQRLKNVKERSLSK